MNREEKKRLTHERILLAARDLFAEQGYETTTVAQIAERAEIAKGTFFNYFPSKEKVICDLQGMFALEEVNKLKDKPGPIIPRLRTTIVDLTNRLQFNRSFFRALLQGTLSSGETINSIKYNFDLLYKAIEEVIEVGQERGEFKRNMPAAMIAQLAVQTYFGTLMMWSLDQGDEKLNEQLAITFELFFAGIATQPQSS